MKRLGLALLIAALWQTAAFAAPADKGRAVATFAGGCFWCEEAAFDEVPGVIATTSGYIGGRSKNPTYDTVSFGETGHAEAVQVTYDPARVSYQQLLDVFWRNVDPLTPDQQFCDVGNQYRGAIFYHDAEQKKLADASKAALTASRRFKTPIVTEIVPATAFYKAEEYHQNYHQKNPIRYRIYKYNCGRQRRLDQLWGRK